MKPLRAPLFPSFPAGPPGPGKDEARGLAQGAV